LTRKQRRFSLISIAGVVLAGAAALVLFALQEEIVFFRTPSDIVQNKVQPGQRFRLGGLVKEGTVKRGQGPQITFEVTDTEHVVAVTFVGILPDLFKEGQGVVTEGILGEDRVFRADSVLAKHDENYMPKEVADVLKEKGVWQGSK
jgi:cytochrome c-type biogenesis protein CcmE